MFYMLCTAKQTTKNKAKHTRNESSEWVPPRGKSNDLRSLFCSAKPLLLHPLPRRCPLLKSQNEDLNVWPTKERKKHINSEDIEIHKLNLKNEKTKKIYFFFQKNFPFILETNFYNRCPKKKS